MIEMRLFSGAIIPFLRSRLEGPAIAGVRLEISPTVLILGIVVFYNVIVIYFQHEWWLGGEMYAEEATNYFRAARSGDLSSIFFSLDAGYFAFPQRLIAFATHVLGFSATSAPYVYSAVALVSVPLLVGVFALPNFRPLIACDLTRLSVVILLLMCIDLDTRIFLNFTYFSMFFGFFLIALSLSRNTEDAPKWAWFLPMLMVSKPHVLTILPAMILAAWTASPRYRHVFLTSIALSLIQIARLIISLDSGLSSGFQPANVTPLDQAWKTIGYFMGYAGAFIAGPLAWWEYGPPALIPAGIVSILIISVTALITRHHANSVIITGLTVMMGASIIICFGLSLFFPPDFSRLSTIHIERSIQPFFGSILLIMAAMCQILVDRYRWLLPTLARGSLSVVSLFLFWQIFTASVVLLAYVTVPPSFPVLHGGLWQKYAATIDRGAPYVCVPVVPFGWVYEESCGSATELPDLRAGSPSIAVGSPANPRSEVAVPSTVRDGLVTSIGIVARVPSTVTTNFTLRAILEYGQAGQYAEFRAEVNPLKGPFLILLTRDTPVHGVRRAWIESDVPIRLLTEGDIDSDAPVYRLASIGTPIIAPAVMWLIE